MTRTCKSIHLATTLPALMTAFAVVALAGSPKELPPVSDDVIQKITAAAPDKAPAKPHAHRKILVFWRSEGFYHGSVPVANKAFEILGKKSGAYDVVFTDDYAIFDPAKLKEFDAVLLNNTTGLHLSPDQRQALLDFVHNGKALIGQHASSDNFNDWPEGAALVGGQFSGHPWGGGGTWAVKIEDAKSPINKGFNGQGFKIRDEIYQMKTPPFSREKVHVLLGLDLSDPDTGKVSGNREDKDYAVAWIHKAEKGRVFYCSLGHNDEVYWNPGVLQHYLAGIQYALGDLKVDDTPDAKPVAK